MPLKTKAFGWALGVQLGEVKAVAHQNHQIVGEHLRVRIIHKVDEHLRMSVAFTPVGSKEEFSFNVKYEKLPNFCLSCGIVGHMTAKHCSIPAEQRKAIYSSDLKAPAWSGSVRHHFDFWGLAGASEDEVFAQNARLPDKVISVVATAVQQLSVAAAPVLAEACLGEKAGSVAASDPGMRVLGYSLEGDRCLRDPAPRMGPWTGFIRRCPCRRPGASSTPTLMPLVQP